MSKPAKIDGGLRDGFFQPKKVTPAPVIEEEAVEVEPEPAAPAQRVTPEPTPAQEPPKVSKPVEVERERLTVYLAKGEINRLKKLLADYNYETGKKTTIQDLARFRMEGLKREDIIGLEG